MAGLEKKGKVASSLLENFDLEGNFLSQIKKEYIRNVRKSYLVRGKSFFFQAGICCWKWGMKELKLPKWLKTTGSELPTWGYPH